MNTTTKLQSKLESSHRCSSAPQLLLCMYFGYVAVMKCEMPLAAPVPCRAASHERHEDTILPTRTPESDGNIVIRMIDNIYELAVATSPQ